MKANATCQYTRHRHELRFAGFFTNFEIIYIFLSNLKFKIMKKVLLFSLCAFGATTLLFAKKQPCTDTVEVSYKRAMSPTFVKEYESCPIIITAQYFKDGFPGSYLKPMKLKKMYFFQCVNIGEEGETVPLTNEVVGNYFVIDKTQADKVMELKRGDKLRITGVTYAYQSMSNAFNVVPYFVVHKIEVLPE
jgi:hypothetical protein